MSAGVIRVAIDAPARRNALSRAVLADLTAALTSLPHEATGVVLHGVGGAFSAGADFSELTGTPSDATYDDAVAGVVSAIVAAPTPVIAAIEGPCVGAGADLALACDLRVAAEGAFVQVPAVRLGLLYNPAAIARLHRSYRPDTVRRLLLLGERFDAASALDAGLVSRLVPEGEAVAVAEELLSGARPEHGPAVAATRRLLSELDQRAADGVPDPARWEQIRRDLLDSPARREAVARAQQRHRGPQREES